MKRFLSFLLAFAILTTLFPITAFASETPDERSVLIQRACDAFPEYAEKITGSFEHINSRTINDVELVSTETRYISENDAIIYSEYSDGTVLLSLFECEATKFTHTYTPISSGYEYDISVTATCSDVNGLFKLSHVKYTIIFGYGSYDYITDTGTPTVTGDCSIHTAYSPIMNETASQLARIEYRLNYQAGATGYYTVCSYMVITVGRDEVTVSNTKVG